MIIYLAWVVQNIHDHAISRIKYPKNPNSKIQTISRDKSVAQKRKLQQANLWPKAYR
jgi:hypothetical protein